MVNAGVSCGNSRVSKGGGFRRSEHTEALKAELVRSVIPRPAGKPTERIDPATRTFLALRMAVNREMENLGELLEDRTSSPMPSGGRMAGDQSFQ